MMLKKNYYELDENSRLEGFCIDLLAELSRDLGFTYTIHLVKDRNYGNDIYGNGTWNGMIGEILRGVIRCLNLLASHSQKDLFWRFKRFCKRQI